MRVALIADVHGNRLALDAVLAHLAEQGGAEAHWLLGDYAAIGPDPVGVLTRLADLPNAVFIRGNTDRYVAFGELPPGLLARATADPAQAPTLAMLAQTLAWAQGACAAAGWTEWLTQLPLEHRAVLPDGTRVLCVHAAPGLDDGPGIHPGATEAELAQLVAGCEAELVVVGHTHVVLDRRTAGVRVFNPGSVSNPLAPDLRASYALLTATPQGHRLEVHWVEYDRAAVIEAVYRQRHPGAAYITRYMRGEITPAWG